MNDPAKQAADTEEALVKARRRVDQAESNLSDAEQMRNAILRDSDGVLSRAAAAKAAGISPGRVQQIISAPWTHRVRFVGILDERAAKALKGGGVKLRTSRSPVLSGPPDREPVPTTKHTVYLVAKSDREALATVQTALERTGSFAAFEAEPVSSGRN
jgi:hypothetical protein